MARKSSLHYIGTIYHVIICGIKIGQIYFLCYDILIPGAYDMKIFVMKDKDIKVRDINIQKVDFEFVKGGNEMIVVKI